MMVLLHNDDAFAAMLLMMCISADKEELVRPLSTAEFYRLRADIAKTPLKRVGSLIGMDLSAVKKALSLSEQDAYRLCVLLNRAMPLSYQLERFAEIGIGIITIDEPGYPIKLFERIYEKAPPVLYYCGELALAARTGVALVGEAKRPEAQSCVRALVSEVGRQAFALVAGDEPGAGRLAEDYSQQSGGRYILCLAGAMSERIYQAGISEMIAARRALALSAVHPDARYTLSHALERNRCLYGLASAAFVTSIGQERGALYSGVCSALRAEWIRGTYAFKAADRAGNRRLIEMGAIGIDGADVPDLSGLREQWFAPKFEQMSMF